MSEASSSQWYYARDKRTFGPVTSPQLRQLAAAGQLLPTDLVQRVGSGKWVPAAQVKRLFPVVEQGPAPAPVAKPAAAALTVARQPAPASQRGADVTARLPARAESTAAAPPDALALLQQLVSRQRVLAEAVVVPDAGRCVQCGCCTFNCPIGIDVRAHAWRGLPIEDSHCLTCSECVKRCPRGVLSFEVLPVFKQ